MELFRHVSGNGVGKLAGKQTYLDNGISPIPLSTEEQPMPVVQGACVLSSHFTAFVFKLLATRVSIVVHSQPSYVLSAYLKLFRVDLLFTLPLFTRNMLDKLSTQKQALGSKGLSRFALYVVQL